MSPEENPGASPVAGTGSETTAEPAAQNEAPSESGEISELMTEMPEVSGVAPGQIGQGRIVKVTDEEVMVDIGLKSEGAIPRAEFLDEAGQLTVQAGDLVDVLIEDYDEQEGTFRVSHRQAALLKAWEELEKASREGTNLKGRVLERTKGGLTVSIGGVRAFLPASQADIRPLRNLDSLLQAGIECKVIKLNRPRNNVVVSRKLALEEEANRRKAELLVQLKEGAELVGRIKNLTSYGAFVDLGGTDGLLHVTDLAWGRVGHPSEVVHVGQEVRVKVLKYDREKERISLGLKQLQPDPWERVSSTYQPGDRVTGRVVSLTDYGAFCELEPGVEGLIHISEMTWSRRVKHPSKFVNIGDRVEVAVLDVHAAQRRISLSLRQTLADPWTTLGERLSPGATVEGRVRNLTDYGAFVEVEDGVEGLIHISDISWTRNVKHPSEVLKKGQEVRALVLGLDTHQRRISLGLKQLEPDAWQEFFDQTPVGSVVRGKVVRLAQFGAFIELREGIEGLCHVSEMGQEHARNGKNPLQVGSELAFRVIRANHDERKVGLSLREIEEHPPKPQGSGPEPGLAGPTVPGSTMMAEKMAEAMRAVAAASAARDRAQGRSSETELTPSSRETETAPAKAPAAVEETGSEAAPPASPTTGSGGDSGASAGDGSATPESGDEEVLPQEGGASRAPAASEAASNGGSEAGSEESRSTAIERATEEQTAG